MATASDSTRTPTRRDLVTLTAAALTGAIIGVPIFRARGPDLSAVAEAWIEDAAELGMGVIVGPDNNIWRYLPMDGDPEREEARERHWIRLGNRPRLRRAVEKVVRGGATA